MSAEESLYHAAMVNVGLVEQLLAKRADVNDPAFVGKDGGPLHAACIFGLADVVKVLVRAKADVQQESPNGQTPLFLAAWRGHDSAVRALIEAKANVMGRCRRGTPPPTAARPTPPPPPPGGPRAPPASDEGGGTFPLYAAALTGKPRVCELLLQSRAQVDQRDEEGLTALYAAALNGHSAVVALLLAHGAEVGRRTRSGRSALHSAAFGGWTDVARILLGARADINAKSLDRAQPLHLALVYGREQELVAFLSERRLLAWTDVHLSMIPTSVRGIIMGYAMPTPAELRQEMAADRQEMAADRVRLAARPKAPATPPSACALQ